MEVAERGKAETQLHIGQRHSPTATPCRSQRAALCEAPAFKPGSLWDCPAPGQCPCVTQTLYPTPAPCPGRGPTEQSPPGRTSTDVRGGKFGLMEGGQKVKVCPKDQEAALAQWAT